MNVPNRERERRDWSLVIFIIPLGIILIIIVGQLAIRLFPSWAINADMRSNLDPNTAPGQPASLLQPLLPQILTQMAWADTYLTPNGDVSFPPFIILEPTGTPSPTLVLPTPTTATPTATTPSPTSTITVTPTSTSGGGGETSTPTATTSPPTTCQDSTATNYGGPLPCTYPPTTCQDPAATNFGGPLPCTYPPTGYPSTIDPGYGTPVTPAPSGLGTGNPDNIIGEIQDGTYTVINLSVEVGITPDANYDLVYYEFNNGGYVYLDWIIIGLSHFADGSSYYEVFNWGNGSPDTNSNANTNTLSPPPYNPCNLPEAPECDDREVMLDDLYDPDGGDNSNSTGVLIDVDNATSQPPPGIYNYVVIISPNGGSTGGPADIDAINTVEVPIP